jgi:hypothetical protein
VRKEINAMTTESDGKIIAIPSTPLAFGEDILIELAGRGHKIALGAPVSQFKEIDVRLNGRDRIYCQPVDMDRAPSTNTFFQIAFAQLGPPDVVVFATGRHSRTRARADQRAETETRRMLHCLDAVLPYVGKEMHFICIAPPHGQAAIHLATAFLAGKLAAMGARRVPYIHMSIVTPSAAFAPDEHALTRTVCHLIEHMRCPEISHTVLTGTRKRRKVRPVAPTFIMEAGDAQAS